jgi:hypothetical protein
MRVAIETARPGQRLLHLLKTDESSSNEATSLVDQKL